MKVSVVVPIYNMENYIENCIQSVQIQDYKDFEVILVDDGSSDSSFLISKRLAAEDNRIKVVHKGNEGVSVARNIGIDIAKGEWIMFVDPDDTLQPTLISSLLSLTNEQTDIVSCCCNAFDDSTSEADYFYASDRTFSSFEEKKELFKQLLNSRYGQPGVVHTAIGVPWGKLYRRSFIETYQLRFNPQLKRYQDNLFNMYAFFYARTICYTNRLLYNYRLDHIRRYSTEYKPGFQIYMTALCEERYTCMKQLKLLEDSELRDFYCAEIQRHLWSILTSYIFSPNESTKYKEKKVHAEEICKKTCFQELFREMPKVFTGKDRIKWYLLKNNHFKTISLIPQFKYRINQLKNR